MRRAALSLAALGAATLLSGCVAGALPYAAEAVARNMGQRQQAAAAPLLPEAPPVDQAPDTMRWLYGSGEAAALSIQVFRGLADYAIAAAASNPADSVILAEGATPDLPRFVPCGSKPKAAVFDVDETVLMNLGYEYWATKTRRGYVSEVWDEWERTGYDAVAPVPGAVTALRRLRDAGITVVFNTNRKAANAASTERALVNAGLGPAVHGETLFLSGDAPGGSAKDPRRAIIASRYCVIAMGGDNLGDFSDAFNAKTLASGARRALAGSGAPAQRLWGEGWFVLSNPVYGPSLAGKLDETFPANVRWEPATTTTPPSSGDTQ
ncbi:5'-nucleotidase, lipoprotein e(P4) family [Novosphingopyxis sp. YJ-S2-01]|uniref:5'-nucleotidase, lipoprotein e(P4) family n=1 Tax=Novosphingopyxis sp. YJ-S2-01 TaxID=2794021 RepID=UPI0018DB5829|nr:HAD family acid phosphatase [Novosphingopyxis sp. YJ-S2-01]MBH9538645.1 acid phosphatase [Novosphingopyxis sp. YJ-S2-01]